MIVAVPVINRPDLLVRFLDSVDEPCDLIVIDNSPDASVLDAIGDRDVQVVCPPSNLGVAASWNLAIRSNPGEPFWIIANADTELAPGDLRNLASEMQKRGPRWVGMNGDWRVFGISAEAVELAGFFDENYHPIYCEDADYEYRCSLAGVPWYSIFGGATHAGSAAIRSDSRYGARNAATHPSNFAYYVAKWGGSLRGGEVFASPFDRGGHVGDWRLDLSRLRANAW